MRGLLQEHLRNSELRHRRLRDFGLWYRDVRRTLHDVAIVGGGALVPSHCVHDGHNCLIYWRIWDLYNGETK